jgi:1-acyl-sn-glycerol-3-phosphate acyltransferase
VADVVEPLAGAAGASPEESARAALRACGLAAIVARLIVVARLEESASPKVFARRAERTARAILALHGVRVRTSGPLPVGPVIVAANHVSYLDPLVVSSVLPCVSIAKGETADWPLIGRGLRALGVVFVRRGDAHNGAVALRCAWRALRDGAPVLNFPEGTTCDGSDVGSFRRGCFGLARLAGVPVVPARIVYEDARVPWYGGETFLPHYWRLARAPGVVARISFGEQLMPGSAGDPDAAASHRDAALAHRARAVVAALGAVDR